MDFKAAIVDQLEKDKARLHALREKDGGSAATFCAACSKNTAVGLYPFYHIYARELCNPCGVKYATQLYTLGLWPSTNP